MDYSIRLDTVTKRYDETVALNGVHIELEKGKVYGLIGRNGAGKTTMLKIMSGLSFPTSGRVTYNKEIIKATTDICYMRDQNQYFNNYRLKQIFYIASKVYPNWDEVRKNKLLEHFELSTKKTYQKCSKGMQTLTAVIIALSSNAPVILLDEPYSGLDPVNREAFYSILREVCFDGEKTVVISSHLINEIEGYFEKAIIVDKGKILIDDDVESIYEKSYAITCNDQVASRIKTGKNVLKEEKIMGNTTLYVYDQFSDHERKQLHLDGAEVKGMDLQKLLVAYCGRMEVKEW